MTATVAAAYARQPELRCAQRDFGTAATACSRSRQGGPAEPQRRPVAPASQLELGAPAPDFANGCGARRMTATAAAAYARQLKRGRAQRDFGTPAPDPADPADALGARRVTVTAVAATPPHAPSAELGCAQRDFGAAALTLELAA
ncbi:hypothetical protein [Kitasatospora sp. NPDC059673]|uniref:hypothetical protein n=1 Tax=Kitasatospora sp. NPDC059673 TaxID=3346901 RepID=UPI00368426F2